MEPKKGWYVSMIIMITCSGVVAGIEKNVDSATPWIVCLILLETLYVRERLCVFRAEMIKQLMGIRDKWRNHCFDALRLLNKEGMGADDMDILRDLHPHLKKTLSYWADEKPDYTSDYADWDFEIGRMITPDKAYAVFRVISVLLNK